MYCHICGANLPDGAKICSACGSAQLPHKKINPNPSAAPAQGSSLPAQGQPVQPNQNRQPVPGHPGGPASAQGQPNGPRNVQGQSNGPVPNPGQSNYSGNNPYQPGGPAPAPAQGPNPYARGPQNESGPMPAREGRTLPPPPQGTKALPTNRGAIVTVFLTALTCGIYGYYFVYKLAQDINTVCEGDGQEQVGGLVQFIIFSILTCGIYSTCWQYSIQERMRMNAPRYGIYIQATGLTVLLYQTLGWFYCCLGPFFSLHCFTSSANQICRAYNRYNNL